MATRGLDGFKELEPNNLIEDLVTYIESELPSFPKSEEFIQVLTQKKNENQHSLSFCIYMTNKCQSKFYFARENAQKGSSVIDIGIYNGAILIFTIEAKLLPTPIVGKSTQRKEHEYVYGHGGGMQRFKEGNHGVDNSNKLLRENGLIAFIKENDFEFWHNKVNQWISDISWDNSEILEKVYFKFVGKLLSTHKRDDNQEFKLHHFWVKVLEA